MSAERIPTPETVFRKAEHVRRQPNQLHVLFGRKAALETLVRKLEREGASEEDIAPYAEQLQDVKAQIPINRPVVRRW